MNRTVTRKRVAVFAAAAFVTLIATASWAQPKAYCPSGFQAKWAGSILRCEKQVVVNSVTPTTCASLGSSCLILVNGHAGQLVVVVGGRDNCSYMCGNKSTGLQKWIERYPTCPTGFAMTQDTGPSGQDLCTQSASSWVLPVLAPN